MLRHPPLTNLSGESAAPYYISGNNQCNIRWKIELNTLLLLVFSRTIHLPSALHSVMEIGPLALRWYVVLALISPLTRLAFS